jgi:hypothetical protein
MTTFDQQNYLSTGTNPNLANQGINKLVIGNYKDIDSILNSVRMFLKKEICSFVFSINGKGT